MKYIFILEDEAGIRRDLTEVIKSIDPLLQTRFFTTLAEFHEWMKVAMQKGILALPEGDAASNKDDELPLIISKNEILGIHNIELIRHTLQFLERKKFTDDEQRTAFIISAFDSPDFNIRQAEDPSITNVLFKPLDKLLIKQHIEFALVGHKPLDGRTISAIDVTDKVEMLKRGDYHTLSEIGFSTTSNAELPIGALTKYYAEIFQAELRKSMYAYCVSSIKKSNLEYANEFHFFAAENAQIAKIRTHITQNQQVETAPIFKKAGKAMNAVIVCDNAVHLHEIRSTLQDKFSMVTVYPYASPEQLQADMINLPFPIDCVFANYELFEIDKQRKWNVFCSAFQEEAKKQGVSLKKDPDLFIISKKKLTPEVASEFYSFAKDILFMPLDRVYAVKKISSYYDTLALQKSTSISKLKEHKEVKISTIADIRQISEAGLALRYHRDIEIGSFREFVLFRGTEVESPEIPGVCNYNEENHQEGHAPGQSPNNHSNHFVFFGMTDHFLKHIRLWIRETYIRQKGEEP